MKFIFKRKAKNDNKRQLSIFDVKELYDAAYDEKAKARCHVKKFKVLLQQATLLDQSYREQMKLENLAQYGEVA